MDIIPPKGCNLNDFLLDTLLELKGIPTDLRYDTYNKVLIVEYIKIE